MESENMNQPQRILHAAFKCMAVKGYANVSMRDIADEAGVVLSQLNYYYKNKEGLLKEIVKTVGDQYLNEVELRLMKGKSPRERISFLIEYFQEILRNKPDIFKLLFDLTSMSLWSPALKELQHDLFNNIASLIEKHIIKEFANQDKYKHICSNVLSRMMLGTLFGTSIQVILADEKEEMIDSLSALGALFE
ncbi:TetR/AcrR family transcriptional regulator [Alkaliphilus crotonatoxidans]